MDIAPTRELVIQKLHQVFPLATQAEKALVVLDTYGDEQWHREKCRVQLAVLMSCNGKLERLRDLIEIAKLDYRDVLVGAEFPEQLAIAPGAQPETEVEAARQRDRQRYEAWLLSDDAPEPD
ncbi:MAG: hypothetical protein AAGI54_12480 [Planctomycetota bacterium]